MALIWKKHSLTIVLSALVFGFLVLSLFFGYQHWKIEGVEAHGSFFVWWMAHSMMEFVGETLVGGLLLVWLTKKLREEGSPESGDDK